MPFIFKKLDIPDVILVEPKVFHDDRGFFFESFKSSDFSANGINEKFVQVNHSQSKKGVIRGLHYQMPPKAQGKLVSVVKGSVIDVAVDIRKNSSTFLKWVRVELSDENRNMLYIPTGFAHGFLALSDDVHFMYQCTDEYSKEDEGGIRWDDPSIAVDWGIDNPIVSGKDELLPLLKDARLFE